MSQQYYSQQDIIAHQQRLKKYIKNNEDIQLLSHIMYEFNPTAFEYFVAFYYASVEGYQTKVNGGYDDEGVDVIGEKGSKKILVQCKKYITQYIKKEHVGYFYGLVVHEKIHNDIEFIYITTSRYTPNAKIFCNDKGITIKSYLDIITMAHRINRQDFQKYSMKHGISVVIPRQLTTISVVVPSKKIQIDSSFEEEMRQRKNKFNNPIMKKTSHFDSISKHKNINPGKSGSYFDDLMNK